MSDAEYKELADELAKLVSAVSELRGAAGESSTEETVADLHARLVKTRQAQDRIESILGRLIRHRSVARMRLRSHKDAYEDALSEVIRKTKVAEFTTARERESTYDLGTFDEKRLVRLAERSLANVEMAYEYVALAHRGIDSARRDIDTRIRILTIESRLEQR